MKIDPELEQWNRQLKELPTIVAVDFDGYLTKDGTMDPNMRHVRKVWRLQRKGCLIVLWSCRVGRHLDEAFWWCRDYDIYPDTINQNVQAVVDITGYDSRKIHADIYLDDKNG